MKPAFYMDEKGELQFNIDDYYYDVTAGMARPRYQEGRGWICELCQSPFDPYWKDDNWKERICKGCSDREMRQEAKMY